MSILKKIENVLVDVYHFKNEIDLYINGKQHLKELRNDSNSKIFYLGIPAHANLGDLAQGICIRRWINKNYPQYTLVELETNALVNTHFSLLEMLKELYGENDFIVFQSGYTTTDLGGYADEMHRAVMQAIPQAKILMMPQTIFFKSNENKLRTSQIYNEMSKMLFLARDKVSYEMAKGMFPDIDIELYPDIVTTLIGTHKYIEKRDGIVFCCRDDGEKFYSNDEINILMKRCTEFASVERIDTTKKTNKRGVVKNAENVIKEEIKTYSKYKVMITDRYHGTILSLVAGTPVIIIKTTDHKVTTGAEWFKGVYDDYVYLAKDLEEAYLIASELYKKELDYNLEPYFEREYYDKLPSLFERNW
ncbi:MAG: hypothetical protein EUB_02391 [Eubacterium sp.]|uniref:polysaccharide pyruvyl transferase family protein n=1 Tax=Eubacterium sp. TaxID=142586 RepID=UPI00307471EC